MPRTTFPPIKLPDGTTCYSGPECKRHAITIQQQLSIKQQAISALLATPKIRTYDWKKDEVRVEGKRFLLGDVIGGKLYHGSPFKLEVGTVLVPQEWGNQNFDESPIDQVSLTSELNDAKYWAKEAQKRNSGDIEKIYVYEVEPLSEVVPWRVMLANFGLSFRLQEGRVDNGAIITKIVEI